MAGGAGSANNTKTMKAKFTKDWRNHKKGDAIRLQANVFMHLKELGVIEFVPDDDQPKKEEVKEAPKRGRKPKSKE